jgi:predicted AAA+ superfamily ATPase
MTDFYIKRKAYNNFLKWKNKENHKPLMIMGARQVGKSYLIKKFGGKEYQHFIEVNLFQRKDIVELYKGIDTSENKFRTLSLLLNVDLENDKTLLFIDEIQESEEMITELKFFNEKHPQMNIICAGSLLGVKLKRSHFSFPVGQVEILHMYPLDFEEFMCAFNEDLLIGEVYNSFHKNTELNVALHTKALYYYRNYLCVGGMPESVKNLLAHDMDITKYDKSVLSSILEAYIADMGKYVANKSETNKIQKAFNSIPSQLSGKGMKFKYTAINDGSRKRDYEEPVDWLIASSLLFQSNRVSIPRVPLKGYEMPDYFKLFISDVGILTKMLDLNFGDVLMDNLDNYKGVIAENFVATNLLSSGRNLNYYKADKQDHEVDFLLYTKAGGIIPIEVKAGGHVKSVSLNKYIEKHRPEYAIRLSTRNFGFAIYLLRLTDLTCPPALTSMGIIPPAFV